MEPVDIAAASVRSLAFAACHHPLLSALAAALLFLLLVRFYFRLTTGICDSDVRLEGKTVFVTGATAGIGKETALDLAKRGARLILGGRDPEKAQRVRQDIVRLSGNDDVHVQRLDLASLASVRQCARELLAREPMLHVLINNAGISGSQKRDVTEDGNEKILQSNHLGHFLLTSLLLDLLKKSSPSRIVVVSSLGHQMAKLDLDDLQSEKEYESMQTYCNSKLANILFTRELASRLHGTGVTVNALHPGVVKTEIIKDLHTFQYKVTKFLFFLMGKTPEEGAQTSIYLAVHPQVDKVSGKYFSDCKEELPSKAARDGAAAKRLWQISEDLVGLSTD